MRLPVAAIAPETVTKRRGARAASCAAACDPHRLLRARVPRHCDCVSAVARSPPMRGRMWRRPRPRWCVVAAIDERAITEWLRIAL